MSKTSKLLVGLFWAGIGFFFVTTPISVKASSIIEVGAPCNFKYTLDQVNGGRAHHGGSGGYAVDLMTNGLEAYYGKYQSCGYDTRVFASISGKVTTGSLSASCAPVPVLDIEDVAAGIKVRYLHMNINASNTIKSGNVVRGAEIGTASNIGGCATGSHVHFEVYKLIDGTYVKQPYANWKFANSSLIPSEVSCKTNDISQVICPVFRFWSDQKQRHFYTDNSEERDNIIRDYPEFVWKYEGVAFFTPEQGASGARPAYRFWNEGKQSHFFTISENEKNNIISKLFASWVYQQVGFYANNKPLSSKARPVYRFWSDKLQRHFFTISENEKNNIITNLSNVWTYEAIAFYAYK